MCILEIRDEDWPANNGWSREGGQERAGHQNIAEISVVTRLTPDMARSSLIDRPMCLSPPGTPPSEMIEIYSTIPPQNDVTGEVAANREAGTAQTENGDDTMAVDAGPSPNAEGTKGPKKECLEQLEEGMNSLLKSGKGLKQAGSSVAKNTREGDAPKAVEAIDKTLKEVGKLQTKMQAYSKYLLQMREAASRGDDVQTAHKAAHAVFLQEIRKTVDQPDTNMTSTNEDEKDKTEDKNKGSASVVLPSEPTTLQDRESSVPIDSNTAPKLEDCEGQNSGSGTAAANADRNPTTSGEIDDSFATEL